KDPFCPSFAFRANPLLEAMFRKYYRDTIVINDTDAEDSNPMDVVSSLSMYARHLGLPRIRNEQRDKYQARITNERLFDINPTETEEKRDWLGGVQPSMCLQKGCLKKKRDF
ncbi:MAG: hypothetical protein Q8O00_09420, partial [Holophaga sp.]|nr:hypothetical protein [Holophaga sp.]